MPSVLPNHATLSQGTCSVMSFKLMLYSLLVVMLLILFPVGVVTLMAYCSSFDTSSSLLSVIYKLWFFSDNETPRGSNSKKSESLWVDLYSPRSYIDLMSDEVSWRI